MREAPIEDNPEAFAFAERLFRDEFDMMILLTGVGTRALDKVLASRYPPQRIRRSAAQNHRSRARSQAPRCAARNASSGHHRGPRAEHLARTCSPRPPVVQSAASPSRNTANRIPNCSPDLRGRGADVTAVRVYQWDLPLDTAPLREAVRRIVAGEADVAMFTTSIQLTHLFRIAAEARLDETLHANLQRMVIASIGPTTTEALEDYGLHADIVPTHPKMGFLVKETADQAAALLERKRAGHSSHNHA